MNAVGELYDALQAFESRHGRAFSYPVHKRLRPDRLGAPDIYDWIVDHLRLRPGTEVLDAGCGVGFGTIRLAERSACRVAGITLSPNELAAAKRAVAQSGVAERIELSLGSFDSPPAGAFDLIVAVESLKHSADLARSIESLRRALAPGGTLVVVEDCYTGADEDAIARRLTRDWRLERLYREADYVDLLGADGCRVVDLSAAVRRRPRAAIMLRLAALGLAGALVGSAVRAAFHGGLDLERLYRAHLVEYKAIFYRGGQVAV